MQITIRRYVYSLISLHRSFFSKFEEGWKFSYYVANYRNSFSFSRDRSHSFPFRCQDRAPLTWDIGDVRERNRKELTSIPRRAAEREPTSDLFRRYFIPMAGRIGPTTLGDPRGADGARMTGELLNIEQEPLLRDRFEEGNNGRLVIVTIVSGNNHHPLGHDATIYIYICMSIENS